MKIERVTILELSKQESSTLKKLLENERLKQLDLSENDWKILTDIYDYCHVSKNRKVAEKK